MIKAFVVGRGWFASEVCRLLTAADNVVVVGGYAPDKSDRLFTTAVSYGLPCGTGTRLTGLDIPRGTDVIVGANTHAYVDASARLFTRFGAIAYHPSLLPRHRGRDSIEWAVRMGDKITGGSVYWMDDGADTGPIAAQDWCWIRPGDNARELWRRDLAPMGLKLLLDVLNDLDDGKVVSVTQSSDVASWEPALTKTPLSTLTRG